MLYEVITDKVANEFDSAKASFLKAPDESRSTGRIEISDTGGEEEEKKVRRDLGAKKAREEQKAKDKSRAKPKAKRN